MNDVVTLAQGAGGKQTSELIERVFKAHLANPLLTEDDAAVVDVPTGRLALSTDGFIVSPAFFPGGDVGKLAVCGTVNDVACMGATPLYLTCAFQIEEGYPLAQLETIVASMAAAAREAGVSVVAGDTKVAGRGQVDGVFITTTGVGVLGRGARPRGGAARPGDAVIVTGDVGRHGCAILLSRDDFGIEADVTSDCAPLAAAIRSALDACDDIHTIRDATRGGVGTVLYEIAHQSGVGVRLDATKVPVAPEVSGVCGMLGLEPLYLACEGRLVVVCPPDAADAVLAALRASTHAEGACVIGSVTREDPGLVVMQTEIGTQTILPEPGNELLPRIC